MTYAYDGYNNRVTMTVTGEDDYVTSYNYNDVNGNYTALLQSETKLIGGLTQEILYTYDANGNQLTKADPDTGLSTFEYDGLNQLIEADCNGKTAQYTYDHNGLRISKTVDGVLTKHIWDGNQIITDVDASVPYGATTYLRGTGLISVQEKYGAQVLTLKYYLQNAHGDVVSLTDSNGIKVKIYRYDAFGVEQNKDDNDSNPFRYCGEYYDSETDTIYLRARYYSPSIGRFISRDSYTGDDNDPLSLNLYTYGANNPVLYADESGHFFNLAAAAVGALVGAAVNVAITAAADYIQNGKITKSASEYAAAAASGAIGGLAAGFTMGGSLAVQVAGQAAIGAATSAAGSVAEQAIVKKEIDWGRVGKDALIGGVSGAVSAGAGALVKKAQKAKSLTNLADDVPMGPSGGNKGCFTAGTLVLTATGYMAIEDIQVGDFVWSENPETGEKALKEVVNTFVHVKDTLVYITINDEVIETTREHPFWIEGQGWTAAELLKFGDIVRLESGENVAIDNVKVSPLGEYIKVYNFEVEDFHTYYVSDDDVLVHNSCKFDKWLNKGKADNKVYFGMDADNVAQYTGITKQTNAARLAQHNRSVKNFAKLETQFKDLTRNQARAIEQYFISGKGPNALNKINSISPKHRFANQAMEWAENYVKSH